MSELNRDERMMARLTAVLDAYGAEPNRWPVDERTSLEAFAADHPEAQVLLVDARKLDVALDSAATPTVRPDLASRIIAAFDEVAARPSVRRLIARLANIVWPGVPVWQPSAAFAVSLMAGLVLGVVAPFGSANAQAPNADIAIAFDVPAPGGL